MDTTNRRKQKSLEEFLDALEQEETADDVPVSEIGVRLSQVVTNPTRLQNAA